MAKNTGRGTTWGDTFPTGPTDRASSYTDDRRPLPLRPGSDLFSGPTFADGDELVSVAPQNRPEGLVELLPGWLLVLVLVGLVVGLSLLPH